jgi:hypothetical protein
MSEGGAAPVYLRFTCPHVRSALSLNPDKPEHRNGPQVRRWAAGYDRQISKKRRLFAKCAEEQSVYGQPKVAKNSGIRPLWTGDKEARLRLRGDWMRVCGNGRRFRDFAATLSFNERMNRAGCTSWFRPLWRL